MNKGLEALQEMYNKLPQFDEKQTMPLFNIIEKELKALEIIKKYILDDEDYLDLIARNIGIPKEELNLLKEVLYE